MICPLLLTFALSAQARPNFLILFADDMGYGDTGYTGHPTVSTPNIDRLAAEGMHFTQWYSGFHLCSPSRASMLTGRIPVRSGTAGPDWLGAIFDTGAKGGLPENETTFASVLGNVGYSTLALGKWHVGQQKKFLPTSHGFDEYLGIPYSVDMGQSAWSTGVNWLRSPPLPLIHNTTVVEQPVNLNTLEKRFVQKTSHFIKRSVQEQKPFLVYLSWGHVHIPDFAAPGFCHRSIRGRFGDALMEMDSHIGDVMQILKDEGVDDNTLVFFTSDNGPWLIQRLTAGTGGYFFEGKSTTWEGGIRMPAIVRWPGKVKAGTVNREMVATYDIFATVVSLGGAQLPQDRVIDGKDLTDVILNGAKSQHRCLFHYKGTPSTGLPPKADDPQPGLWAVRCGAYKAHFVTSCSIMHHWGDVRCGGLAPDLAVAPGFEECKMERTPDECTNTFSSGPVIQDPPLLYNVEHDTFEMYPIHSSSREYAVAMQEILAARKVHEATLTPVPNQMGMGQDSKLYPCCDPLKLCICNPENFFPPEEVCTSYWYVPEPSKSSAKGSGTLDSLTSPSIIFG